MAFIEIRDLTHIYNHGGQNEYVALDKISLDIDDGEFVAILGANGSGKSTLARHLNAILLPTEGVCRIDGNDTKECDSWKIHSFVGMVFQNPDNQLVAPVAEDDVAFGPENLGVPPAEITARVTESLKTVGMENFRKAGPHRLSGGQKQRIAIAGALAMRTRCLVLDEPTAMLDPNGRAEVIATAAKLNREQGITIVYITHFMEEAAAAQRIIVMERGKIVADGAPQKIFSRAEKMKSYGLDVPLASYVAMKLRQRGIKIADEICTDEELIAALKNIAG